MGFARKFVVAALFSLCLQPAQADAGCGCEKPPPPVASIRPAFASPGDEVSLFAPGIEQSVLYQVTFSSTTEVSVWARAKFRRDFADGIHTPQVVVEVPDLPPGPTSVTVRHGSTVVLEVGEHDFTTLQQPIVLSEANLTTMVTCYRAAVGADSTVYIPVDVSAIAERMIFAGVADGYRLMFGAEDIVIYNTQGVLMQLLGPEQADIFAIYDEGAESSFSLIYDRHEFVTYRSEHFHVDGYGLDSADPEWHTNGTRHVDHDHLVLAIRGLVHGEELPVPGQTPQFTFTISTVLGDTWDGAPIENMLVQDNCNDDGNPETQKRQRKGGNGKGGQKGKDGKKGAGGAAPEGGHDDGNEDNPSEGARSDGPPGQDGGDGIAPDDPGNDVDQDGDDDGSTTQNGGDDDDLTEAAETLCGATPRMDCHIMVQAGSSQLLIKDRTPDSRDGLVWKWLKGESTEPTDFGDLMTTGSLGFCMYDESEEDPELVFRAMTEAEGECSVSSTGGYCWRGLGRQLQDGSYKQYRYRNKRQTPDGIGMMALKSGGDGKGKLLLKAKGENLTLPVLPLGLTLLVQLHAETGECWEATYSQAGVKNNSAQQFKGTAD